MQHARASGATGPDVGTFGLLRQRKRARGMAKGIHNMRKAELVALLDV